MNLRVTGTTWHTKTSIGCFFCVICVICGQPGPGLEIGPRVTTVGILFTLVTAGSALPAQDSVIRVPIRVHLLHSSQSASLTTTLTEREARDLLNTANTVWRAAGIHWEIESVVREESLHGALFDSLITQQLPATDARQLAIIPRTNLLNPGWNLFLIRDYGQIAGGVFWPEVPGIVLAQKGMGIDLPPTGRGGFTLAHELGHSLGLRHVPCDESRNILAVGCWRADSTSTLAPAQIRQARAQAQTGRPSPQAPSVRIRGQVTDSLGIPISRAEVLLRSASITRVTDSLGLFSLGPVESGLHLLQVRAIGWRPVYFTIQTEPGEEWVGRVGLEQMPQTLPEIRVTSPLAKPERYAGTTKYDDFFRRRRTATGVFRLRDEIERLAPLNVADLLKGVPSVRVSFNGPSTSIRFDRCNQPGAKAGVWLDGVRIRARSHDEALSLIHPNDIEAIEIYASVSRIPGEFLDDSCAAIVVWSR